MKKLLVLFILASTCLFAQENAEQLIAKGDSLYGIFDNQGALEAYLKVLEADSLNYEANWKASRGHR